MKTAIVGSNGYIAKFILQRFEKETEIEQILKIDQDTEADMHLNLQEPEKFDYEVLDDIDYLVFTAAVSSPDRCASEFGYCWTINVTGTNYFIREAIKHKCHVLFFSSDAVFGDTPGIVYDEKSVTAATTPYGKMKKAVEDEFKGDAYFKAIRLSYVASAKDRFITYCLECIQNQKSADIFHPFYRNVITASDVADIAVYFAKHWDEYEPAFLNVAGRELVSRIRIADELNRIFHDRLKYTVSMPEDGFFTNRPRITQMESRYLQEYGILKAATFTEKIQKELEGIEL